MFLIRKYRNSEFLSEALHNTHSQGETPGGESGGEKIKGGPHGNGALSFFSSVSVNFFALKAAFVFSILVFQV